MIAAACVMIGTLAVPLSRPRFSLGWTYSIERTEWREEWAVGSDGLRLVQAAVKGSGAGMEPGDGAVLRDGWWVWTPDLPPQRHLALAASGMTGAGWTLCDGGVCRDIGTTAGSAVTLSPCPGQG